MLIEQELRWLPLVRIEEERKQHGFVRPGGYDEIEARFAHPGQAVLVLCGRPNTGRRASALKLLAGSEELPVYECLTDWSPSPRTDVLPRAHGGRFLLDLTDEDDEIPEQFGRGLADYSRDLARRGARMIVLVTEPLWRSCARETLGITVHLDLPDLRAVTRAHLEGYDQHLAWLDREPVLERLANTLTNGSLRRAVELAETILKHSALDERDAAAVHDEFFHWKTYLDRQLTAHKDPSNADPVSAKAYQSGVARARALLITVAVLDGAPDEVILDAADALLAQLGHKPSGQDLLLGPELGELIARIDADHVGGTITITKRFPGADYAVLDRVWVQRPRLRKIIRTWLEAITADGGAAADHEVRVADVLVRLATDLGSLEIVDIAQTWLGQKKLRQRDLAVDILGRLSTHAETGSAVRRKLYEWAKKPNSTPAVLTGVADVCTGPLARHSPKAALLRLRLLLVHETPKARTAAATALRRLATDDALGDTVIAMVLAWYSGDAPQAGAFALLALADPIDEVSDLAPIHALTSTPAHRDALRRAWTDLILQEETHDWAMAVLQRWLVTADVGRLDSDLVIATLAPVVTQGLTGDRFKRFITDAHPSKTRGDLLVAMFRHTVPTLHTEATS